MNICELIEACGVQNARLQFIDQCAATLNYNHKAGTKITFSTDVPLTPKGPEKFGIVIWLDREAVADAQRKAKAPA